MYLQCSQRVVQQQTSRYSFLNCQFDVRLSIRFSSYSAKWSVIAINN